MEKIEIIRLFTSISLQLNLTEDQIERLVAKSVLDRGRVWKAGDEEVEGMVEEKRSYISLRFGGPGWFRGKLTCQKI